MSRNPTDGAYYSTGTFVYQRALTRMEGDVETVVSQQRSVCEVITNEADPSRTAKEIACAMNAQFKAGQ